MFMYILRVYFYFQYLIQTYVNQFTDQSRLNSDRERTKAFSSEPKLRQLILIMSTWLPPQEEQQRLNGAATQKLGLLDFYAVIWNNFKFHADNIFVKSDTKTRWSRSGLDKLTLKFYRSFCKNSCETSNIILYINKSNFARLVPLG